MNLLSAQIAAPAPASPSEGAASLSRAAKSTNSAGDRKSFSSVLRTIRQEEGRARSQKPSDTQSSGRPDSDSRTDRVERMSTHASQTDDSQTQSSVASTKEPSEQQRDKLTDVAGEDRTSPMVETDVHSAAQGAVLAFIHSPAPDPTTMNPVALEFASTQEALPTDAEHDETTVLSSAPMSVPLAAMERPVLVHATDHDRPLSDDAPTFVTTHDEPPSGAHVSAGETDLQTSRAAGPETRSLPGGAERKTTAHRGEAGPVLPQPEQRPPTQQAGPLHDQDVQVYQELPRQDGIAHHRTPDSTRVLQERPPERSAPAVPQVDTPSPLHKEEHESKPISALPHDRQAFTDDARQSDMPWSEHGSGEQAHEDTSLPRHIAESRVHSNPTHATFGEVITAGTAAQSTPRPAAPPAGPFAAPGQSIAAARDTTELPMPAMARSVVLEVAQPDLGRINVRVAMNHDMVHTFLLSDRPEVGQFLLNGQDRLQAALQTNGLDMGQFRVDIDRHSAGRSFEQGYHPQEQGRAWPQAAAGSEHEHRSSETQDIRHTRSYGTLNLVA